MRPAAPRLLLLSVALTACGIDESVTHGEGGQGAGADEGEEGIAGEGSRVSLVTHLGYAAADDEGRVQGFDLDGRASQPGDPEACLHGDFTAPDGSLGIDNQLARFAPVLEAYSEGALAGLIQGSINDGGLLILLELTPEDGADPVSGPFHLRVRRGAGAPLLSTTGAPLASQTVGLHEDAELGETGGVTLDEAGIVLTPPFDFRLPVVVFGILYLFDLTEAHIRFRLGEHGSLREGIFGGHLAVEKLMAIVETAAGRVADDLVTLFGPVIRDSADLDRDDEGVCRGISAAMTFEGEAAFIFE